MDNISYGVLADGAGESLDRIAGLGFAGLPG